MRHKQTGRQKDRVITDRQRQTGRDTDRQAVRYRDRQSQTDRQKEIELLQRSVGERETAKHTVFHL